MSVDEPTGLLDDGGMDQQEQCSRPELPVIG
jgi:hypothetical protein